MDSVSAITLQVSYTQSRSCLYAMCVQLTLEKEALENKLEAEQEYIVNRLQKQVRGAPLPDCMMACVGCVIHLHG